MENIPIECLNLKNVYQLCALSLFLSFVYWLYCIPCNWKMKKYCLGSEINSNSERRINNKSRKQCINRMRTLRKCDLDDLPPPFPNGWYSVMESSEVRRGEVKTVSVFGEQLVVFRTLNTTPYVLDAYCPHLGANVGKGGIVVGDTIVCPFHKWSFRGSDGNCDGVPYSSCAPQFSKLKKWISCEVNEHIFVWYSSVLDQIPWKIPSIKEIETKEFIYQGRNEFHVNCHIQEIPENGADLAHFSSIHSASILAGGSISNMSFFKNAGTHTWQALWQNNENSSKHIARIALTHSLKISESLDIFSIDVVGEQIGPALVQLHVLSPKVGRIEITQTITPIRPLVQKVVHRFYAARSIAPFVKFAVVAESIMFERDINVWNHKIYRKHPDLVKEDSSIKAFRNWYQQFYTRESRKFCEVNENVEW